MMIHQPKSKTQAHQLAGGAVFDVVIVGAGVVGCAMARRFTLEGARVALIEKAADILDGASKANSAILHTGFDAPPGSLELECIRAGYEEYRAIRAGLGLAEEQTGALVVAWDAAQLARLEDLQARARENGIGDVHIVSAAGLRAREPGLSARALGAMVVPGESIIDPWTAPYAYLAQALENGARAFLSCALEGGRLEGGIWHLDTARGVLRARAVINCAGLFGDEVDRMLLGRSRFRIMPRKGQFVVFDKAARRLVNGVILPVPDERTKGIVLFPTVFGNLVIGPTAEEQESRTDASCDRETLEALIATATRMVPALEGMPVTAAYAGLRPATEKKHYRIDVSPAQRMISVGGIRSTGLSAALGIARHVWQLYEELGHASACRPLRDPVMPEVPVLAQAGPRDWHRPGHGAIVCHCELVTEREVTAALSGPLAARSLAGLKRRTRVTMGQCQGFYCTARLAELSAGHFDTPLGEDMKAGAEGHG